MLNESRTIVALATTPGEASISVIRVSGPSAIESINKIISKSRTTHRPLFKERVTPNSVCLGYVFNSNEIIDEVVCTVFISPKSYTGEDTVEISSHGGFLIYRKIIELLIKQGCRLAEPGEFTRRAFVNGKIDLSQAEAVADLIRARTDGARKLATEQLRGKLSQLIQQIRDKLIYLSSMLELDMDFSEEELSIISNKELLNETETLIKTLCELAKSYTKGKVIRDGINIAIIGEPNVGKSSLFNRLLNDSRVIVTDMPGTTRDFIEETIILNGTKINLIDTAGLRETEDIIEKIGINKSIEKTREADLVIELVDATSISNITNNNKINGKVIRAYNKSDLINKQKDKDKLYISAKTGDNIEELEKLIRRRFEELESSEINTEIIITSDRHKQLIEKTLEYLYLAKKNIGEGLGAELISYEIRMATNKLSEIIGITTNEEILNNIFSKFCIGK